MAKAKPFVSTQNQAPKEPHKKGGLPALPKTLKGAKKYAKGAVAGENTSGGTASGGVSGFTTKYSKR
jgi:hypothetical protein